MRNILRPMLFVLACLAAPQLGATGGNHANHVSYISSTGNDANSGLFDAPCKTWAAAISDTAFGGTVIALDQNDLVLDTGLSITWSITLDGGPHHAGIVANLTYPPGSSVITIAAGLGDVVLKNFRVSTPEGGSPGVPAIVLQSAQSLTLQNVEIEGNGFTDGIQIQGGVPASTHVFLDHVTLRGESHAGVYIGGGTLALRDVVSSGCGYGLVTFNNPNVELDDANLSGNGVGLRVLGGILRLSNCTITGNATGISATGGTVNTFGNNHVGGNTAGNGPLGTAISPQ